MIEGDLTKTDLETLFSHVDDIEIEDVVGQKGSNDTLSKYLAHVADNMILRREKGLLSGSTINESEAVEGYTLKFTKSDINRLLSAFTSRRADDFITTAVKNGDAYNMIYRGTDYVYVSEYSPGEWADAAVTSDYFNGSELDVYSKLHYTGVPNYEFEKHKKAVFTKQPDGKFVLDHVENNDEE